MCKYIWWLWASLNSWDCLPLKSSRFILFDFLLISKIRLILHYFALYSTVHNLYAGYVWLIWLWCFNVFNFGLEYSTDSILEPGFPFVGRKLWLCDFTCFLKKIWICSVLQCSGGLSDRRYLSEWNLMLFPQFCKFKVIHSFRICWLWSSLLQQGEKWNHVKSMKLVCFQDSRWYCQNKVKTKA